MSEIYEFTEAQNVELQRLVNCVRHLAHAVYLAGASYMAVLTLHTARNLQHLEALFPLIGTTLFGAAITMMLAAALTKAASSFQLVIDTEGNDVEHALEGLGQFTKAFRVGEFALWAISLGFAAILFMTVKGMP